MPAIALFLFLLSLAAALIVSGAYVLGGSGPALIVGGLCSAMAAFGLRRGMTNA